MITTIFDRSSTKGYFKLKRFPIGNSTILLSFKYNFCKFVSLLTSFGRLQILLAPKSKYFKFVNYIVLLENPLFYYNLRV